MITRDLYLFGSVVTGEIDSNSDVDILVISDDSSEREKVPQTWSLYSSDRIAELFERGTLFAWHLYLESVFLSSKNGSSFIESLGKPCPYSAAAFEIQKLTQIACDALLELEQGTVSAIYELGLLHVSLRNIAMAASPHLTQSFNFSKYAPFKLTDHLPPISMSDYKILMECRRSSTRGISVKLEPVFLDRLLTKRKAIYSWCESVYMSVQNE